jgi:hypothetical protein
LIAGEGSVRERGAKPPLKVSPPLKQNYFLSCAILPFERGIKGESMNGVSLDDEKNKTE